MMIEGGDSGGHNGFDTQAEETGFDYLLEEQKKTLQNNGFKGNILQEALFLSLPIYEKRHAMNEAFWNSELQRETETVTNYELRYNKDRNQYEMYHPGYETYLQDMLVRTERYAIEQNKPHVFNKDETEAILQAERALINGDATSILYPVWHESGKVRYITEMTIDGGLVKNRYVDIGKIAGKDLSKEEAAQMLQDLRNLHDGHAEKKDDYGPYSILVLKDGEVGFKEIAMSTFKNINDGKEEKSQETWLVPKRLVEEDGYRRPTYLVKNADRKGKIYFWDGITGEHGLLGTLQIAELMYKEKFIPFIQHKREGKKDIWATNAKERGARNPQKDVHPIVSRIEKQKEEIGKKKKGIVFAQKTGIGVGGALFILDSMAGPIMTLTKKEKREIRREKRGAEKRTSEGGLRKKEIKRADKKLQKNREIKKLRSSEKKRDGYKETKKLRNKEMVNTITSLKEKKQIVGSKEKRKKEKFDLFVKEVGLLTLFLKITRRYRFEKRRTRKNPERKISLYQKEQKNNQRRKENHRIHVMEFTRSWIIFMLLHISSSGKRLFKNKENVILEKRIKKEEKSIYESLPWVLLSIIWHMSAIREQGKTTFIPPQKKKNSIKKKSSVRKKRIQRMISGRGIIYAYQW